MPGVYNQGSSKRLDFPLPDLSFPLLAPFWDAAARDEFHLPFCSACATCRWYPSETCGSCGGEPLAWRRLSGKATVYSFTVIHHVFLPQYRDLVPFVAALIVPDEAPAARVATRLVDVEPSAVRCDLRVEVTFTDLRFAGVEGTVRAPVFRAS